MEEGKCLTPIAYVTAVTRLIKKIDQVYGVKVSLKFMLYCLYLSDVDLLWEIIKMKYTELTFHDRHLKARYWAIKDLFDLNQEDEIADKFKILSWHFELDYLAHIKEFQGEKITSLADFIDELVEYKIKLSRPLPKDTQESVHAANLHFFGRLGREWYTRVGKLNYTSCETVTDTAT